MNNLLEEFKSIVLNKVGIDLSIFSESYYNNVVQKWMSQMNLFSIEDVKRYIDENPNFAFDITNVVMNHYSEFFRNQSAFVALKEHILPQLLEVKSTEEPVRIWSVGCSKGQEPYSIAIACYECMHMFRTSFDFTIFATDVDDNILETAAKGEFTTREVQNLTLKQLDDYFVRTNTGYRIKDVVKKRVRFSSHNIILQQTKYPIDSIYGDFDIIMISNVLIYYQDDVQNDVVHQLLSSLSNYGYLISSKSERQFFLEYMNPIVMDYSSTIFKKAYKE